MNLSFRMKDFGQLVSLEQGILREKTLDIKLILIPNEG